MKRKRLWIVLYLLGLLTGCGARGEAAPVAEDTLIESVLSTIPYEEAAAQTELYDFPVPEHLPGILVDRDGYECQASKQVIFLGEDIAESFTVIDAETGEAVYTGEIRRRMEEDSGGAVVWRGDFTELQTEGSYYVTTAGRGRSYRFTIRGDIYERQRLESLQGLHRMRCGDEAQGGCHRQEAEVGEGERVIDVAGGWHTDGRYDKDTKTGAGMVMNLLLAYECEASVFTDDTGLPQSGNGIPDLLDEIRWEAEWLLKMQDESGGVSGGVFTEGVTDYDDPAEDHSTVRIAEIEDGATALYACAMARFGSIYRAYDAGFADRCVYSAEEAYQYLASRRELSSERISTELWYMLNAELFKTTGKDDYHSELRAALAGGILPLDAEPRIGEIDPVFFGDYAYLTTGRYADKTLCGKIMDQIMETVREIAEEASRDPYLVDTDGYGIEENAALLRKMQLLTYVNCIITNREYRTVIQEHMHYLGGRNAVSEVYVTDRGVRTAEPEEEHDPAAEEREIYYGTVRMMILSSIDNHYIQVE